MVKKKYYAVRVGKTPGIYESWDVCKDMIHGFPGAVYKSFPSRDEAEKFMNPQGELKTDESKAAFAFVDGSFNLPVKTYGFGGFLECDGKRYVLQGSGTDLEMAKMRNVAGEILGSMAAVKKALELGLPQVVIYYDYMGIEMWATGAWKRNKTGTIEYYEFMQEAKKKIQISFQKVKGHSGVEGNELADKLAKEAVGIS
jgi:viroplasmin and RNaseH domain-containing protein